MVGCRDFSPALISFLVLLWVPNWGGVELVAVVKELSCEAKAEMFLQWNLLPQTDFSFLVLVVKWGSVSDLSSVNIISISLQQDFCWALSVSINRALYNVLFDACLAILLMGWLLPRKSCKHVLVWSNERMWGKVDVLFFPFQKGKKEGHFNVNNMLKYLNSWITLLWLIPKKREFLNILFLGVSKH